jgi:hypothetical protein
MIFAARAMGNKNEARQIAPRFSFSALAAQAILPDFPAGPCNQD